MIKEEEICSIIKNTLQAYFLFRLVNRAAVSRSGHWRGCGNTHWAIGQKILVSECRKRIRRRGDRHIASRRRASDLVSSQRHRSKVVLLLFYTTYIGKVSTPCGNDCSIQEKRKKRRRKMPARNKEQESEIMAWIEAVLGEKLPPGNYEDILKDGVILCKLINKLAPGSVKKIQAKGTNFQLMENVQRFQAAIKQYGVPQEEIFQTADLFERRNIPQVTLCLYALGRITQKHPEYTGPRLGPKMSDENKRIFSEEQLRASEGQLNLQMGFNKGASQAGHGGFGNTRHM